MRPMPGFVRPRIVRRGVASALVACPRVSPEWDFAAARALLKPQTGRQLSARPAGQDWTAADAVAAAGVVRRIAALLPKLGAGEPVCSAAGEYHLILPLTGAASEHEQRAVAMALSAAVPGRWFVGGGAFVRDGFVYRRERGYKLRLTRLRSYHLPRDLRRRLSPVLPVRRRTPTSPP